MAKKASGKHYTSKGERQSSISTKNTDPGQRLLNQINALKRGKNVVMTVGDKKVKINGKEWLAKRQGVASAKSEVKEEA